VIEWVLVPDEARNFGGAAGGGKKRAVQLFFDAQAVHTRFGSGPC